MFGYLTGSFRYALMKFFKLLDGIPIKYFHVLNYKINTFLKTLILQTYVERKL